MEDVKQLNPSILLRCHCVRIVCTVVVVFSLSGRVAKGSNVQWKKGKLFWMAEICIYFLSC